MALLTGVATGIIAGHVEVDHTVRNQFEHHLRAFFSGHPQETRALRRGPIESRLHNFHVDVFQPGPRQPGAWTFITCGAASVLISGAYRLEFLLIGLRDDHRWLELTTMLAYYHAGPELQRFGLGHTLPIGEPIVSGATCDALLFSLPYPFGPDLERCELSDGTHLQVLWALPITSSERAFKNEHGLEELEARFEKAGLEYWDMARRSVV